MYWLNIDYIQINVPSTYSTTYSAVEADCIDTTIGLYTTCKQLTTKSTATFYMEIYLVDLLEYLETSLWLKETGVPLAGPHGGVQGRMISWFRFPFAAFPRFAATS